MTFTATAARQALLDALGHGPHSMPMLAGEMIRRGCVDVQAYFWARMAVKDGLTDRVCEAVTLSNGDVVWRLPANTPFENPKGRNP